MASWVGYLWPSPELYKETLTSSLTDGLVRPVAYDGIDLGTDALILYGTKSHTPYVALSHNRGACFKMPTYADDLWNHFLIIPSRLDLGNLLTNQERDLEVANLYFTDHQLTDVENDAGTGITFLDLPTFPYTIPSFNSFTLKVSVATVGAPSISGFLALTTDLGEIDVPVTGQRITLWPFLPEEGYTETLQWATDILEAYEGTESRISIRMAPRQVIKMTCFSVDQSLDAFLRFVLFDWLARVWGVPAWWDMRIPTQDLLPGDNVIHVNTTLADFRAGGLVMVRNRLNQYEAFEIESFDAASITITSVVVGTYKKAISQIVPVLTAYAQTQTQQQVQITGVERVNVQFTTLGNVSYPDISTWTIYQGLPVLDDLNILQGEMAEGFQRDVVVIDNKSGEVFQTAFIDRSKFYTEKQWSPSTQAAIWRIRQFLYWTNGSQLKFFVPTARNDFVLSEPIAGGATSFKAKNANYAAFGQGRRPFGDVRITLVNGTKIMRQITGATYDPTNNEDSVAVDTAITASPLALTDVFRIELMVLCRIADDQAQLTHLSPGEADIKLKLQGVKS
jgi:hypothetical protein